MFPARQSSRVESSRGDSGDADSGPPIVIVGAGFSGLGMAIRLQAAGIDNFTIIERAGEVGGTWRDNHYPGAACDVASHLYSYSFEPNPNWSRAFGRQQEILEYIRWCADKYDLRRYIRFNTVVVSAAFDEATGFWQVHMAGGEVLTARALISAVGALVDPAFPRIEGLNDFRGRVMHTACWDETCTLAGKRVAVIGAGASAIQVVPEIAKAAVQLSVFQRTPSWIMPKPDRAITEEEKVRYRASAFRLAARRLRIYWTNELLAPLIISDLNPLKKLAEKLARSHIHKQVADPALRRRVTPDYRIGCKRVLISNDWYPTLQQDHVQLETDGIDHIGEQAIITGDGRSIPVDVIVCATGFRVPSQAAPFAVTGRAGRALDTAWAGGAEAYKGVTVARFPNLFFLMGPNTGPSHTSVLAFTEQQMVYILQAIQHLRRHRLKFLDVKAEVQARFNRGIQWRMKHTAWTSGCTSWYLTDSGKNTTLYPGFNWEYRLRLRRFRPQDYEQVYPGQEPLSSGRAA